MFEKLEQRRLLSAGDIDATFAGGAGIATVGYRLNDDQKPAVVATQDDGKVLIAWNGATAAGVTTVLEQPPLFLARYNPDGTPDATFGGTANGQPMGTPAGVVAFTNDRVIYNIARIVPVAGGKVVLAGQSKGGTTQEDVAVVRLNANGQLDSTFGGAGRGFTGAPNGSAFFDFGGRSAEPFETNLADRAVSADVSATGQIIVSANAQVGQDDFQNRGVALLLLNADGTKNSGFATSGQYLFTYETFDIGVTTEYQLPMVTFDEAGNIIADVHKVTIDPAERVSAHTFLQVAPNGIPDLPTATVVTLPVLITQDDVHATFPLPDGSLLYTADSQYGLAIGLINNDLSGSNEFGSNGLTFLVPPDGEGIYVNEQIAVLPDGRFYVSASYQKSSLDAVNPVYLARFDAQGIFDASFGMVKVADGTPAVDGGGTNIVVGPVAQALAVTTNGDAVPVLTNRFLHTPDDLINRYQLLKVDGGPGIKLNSKGTLTVGGTAEDDIISLSIRAKDGKLIVRVNDLAVGFAPSKLKRIRIYGQDGADTITLGIGVKGSYVSGGQGHDTATGGDGPDILEGGFGNDVLSGGAGADKIAGFEGNDQLFGGGGADALDGGNDADTLSGDSGNDKLFGGFDTPDTLMGSSGNDVAEDDQQDTRTGIEALLA